MKKALKIAGTAVLALVLVLNLEYAVFSGDVTNTPNKAFADWYSGGVHYCGSSPNTYVLTGYWTYYATNDSYTNPYYPNPVYDNGGYECGVWKFTPDYYGYDCGPDNPYSSGSNSTIPGWTDPFAGYYTTSASGGYGPY